MFMSKICKNSFAAVISIIFVAVFLVNLVLSRKYNLIMIAFTGGGKLVDLLGASQETLFNKRELYRLVTYGYLHPTVWHLAANVYALWYVGLYIEKKLSKPFICLIYHVGLFVSGAVFLLIFPNGYMYGASPAIFCFLGLMAMWFIRDSSLLHEYKELCGNRYLLFYMILSNFLGLGTFVVHLTGFCVGLLLGFVVKKKRNAEFQV
ncbi:Membrane associated serine protease, rhomboid family [Butyrivibrio sp. INlla16]|nr:Membrane associated serine protease, rhomboid family [Butyrivibrio sp. INlla16]